LVDIYSLKRHEEISYERLFEVLERIKKDGFVRNPVVADYKTRVVLDGHHRLCALKMMGLSKCPVFFVDYFSCLVRLYPRRKEYLDISKRDVIKMGKSNYVFPNKTTRHCIRNRVRNERVRIEDL
jgi:L-serine kinase (ADP)